MVEQFDELLQSNCSILDFRTTFSLNHLPLEILHGIFHYLDIPDIVRIRRVSRHLNEVGHSRDIWSDAYRKADFVCPPGPFLSQSAHDLESALVSSFRVDQNLQYGGVAQGERHALKLREIRYTGVDLCVSLVFGRFLFIALSEEVRCYDLNLDALDSNSGASIIYRPTSGTLKSFRCVSAIDAGGRPSACVVLSEATQTTTQVSIYSLNVGEQCEVTLDLLHQSEHSEFEIDTVDLGPRVIIIQGRTLDLDVPWRLVAMDVHTRTQFLFPSFTQKTWMAGKLPEWTTIEEITSLTSISTSTHLLLAISFYTQATGWCTFFEAYALPHLHMHRHFVPIPASTPLDPSHRGTIPGINVRDTVLLQDAVLDPSTQDVMISIRVHAFEPSRPRSSLPKHGILRLSASHGHKVGTIAFQLLGSLGQSRVPFLHPSFNGAGRVFYTPGHGIVSMLEYDLRTSGGEDEVRVTEYPFVLRFPAPRTLLDYDPYSGRICLRSCMAKYRVIEILDLAI